MIDRQSLLADLQKQVKAAETDLEQQVKAVPEVGTRLRGEYEQARKLGRTSATWNAWLGERITQVAVAWVLGTVFVRFSEDNRLIAEPYITSPDVAGRETAQARFEEYLEEDTNPTYRGWLETAFAELAPGKPGGSSSTATTTRSTRSRFRTMARARCSRSGGSSAPARATGTKARAGRSSCTTSATH